jgi:hypothetical protein
VPGAVVGTLSIDGFLKFETSERLSQRTITYYEYTLNHWLNYIDDQTTLMTTFPLGCTFSKYQKASEVLLIG